MKTCLVCDKELEFDNNFTYGATIWKSNGNYGSTVFDPLHGNEHLEAFVCDECLLRKKSQMTLVITSTKTTVVSKRTPDFKD